MANLGETFDIDFLPQGKTSFDPIPAGWYTASMSAAELKATKAGTGQYIAIRYDVTGPTHQGRVVYGNLNIKNQSPKAEEIGRQQLRDILEAIGVPKVSDTDQLIGHSLQIKVDVEKSEQYGDKNQIKAFKAIEGGAPPKLVSTPMPTVAKAAPPWAKK
jgi:hypothetical protein